MSAPVRFLAFIVVGWVGVRAMTVGALPGFTFSYAKPAEAHGLPPIVATRFAPIPPLETAPPAYPSAAYAPYPPYVVYAAYPPARSRAVVYAPYSDASAAGPIPPRPPDGP